MKRFVLSLVMGLGVFSVQAQAPQAINYQAVAHDLSTGDVYANQNIDIRFSIIPGSPGNTAIYVEEHTGISTNVHGLFNVRIGNGTATTGTFTTVAWGNSLQFLKVEIDDGSGYQVLGTTQFLSVPYALYAESAGAAGSYTAGSGIDITGGVISNTGDADNDATNEIQVISISNDTLYLSSGGFAVLPAGQAYTAGAGIDITGSVISNMGDNDNDSANELQNLSFSVGTGVLNIDDAQGNIHSSVTIPSSPWTNSAPSIYYSSGNVGIGTASPSTDLHVNGNFRLVDGTQQNNYILSSDALGNASWVDPTTLPGDADWTITANDMSAANTGAVQIGASGSPSGKLHVENNQFIIGSYARTSFNSSANTYAMYGDNNANGTGDKLGAYFISSGSGGVNNYGVGGDASGGSNNYGVSGITAGNTGINYGVRGVNMGNTTSGYGVYGTDINATGTGYGLLGNASSSNATTNYGAYASASSASGNNYGVFAQAGGAAPINYGVYGAASGATAQNYAGYFADGDVFVQNGFILPTGANLDYVLRSDAAGNASWVDPSTLFGGSSDEITDADGDTKIQVEEGTDDDHIRFDTDGTEVMLINNFGNVGIGTSSPTAKLEMEGANVSAMLDATTGNPALYFSEAGSDQYNMGYHTTSDYFWIGEVGVAEHMIIADGGSVGFGMQPDPAANVHIGSANPATVLAVQTTSSSNADDSPLVTILRARGTAIGSEQPVLGGDRLGKFEFAGWDGGGWHEGASIRSEVHGNWLAGTNSGADLQFQVTPSGTYGSVEAMRIADYGFLGINETSPAEMLHVRQGNILVDEGHYVSLGPTLTASDGTSGSNSFVVGNDVTGHTGCMTIGISGGLIDIAFNAPYLSNPTVVLTPANFDATQVQAYVTSTTTGFSIIMAGGSIGMNPDWNYMVIGGN